MKLSVIVPVYNVKNYLRDCIDSLINQDYKDLEIILVDDGSTDGSAEICDEYAKEFESIKVLHNSNHGVSHARNCGLQNASGELITFIDSDDTIDLNTYSSVINEFDEDIDIVHFSYKRIDNEHIFLIGGTNEMVVHNKTQALELFIKGEKFNGSICNKVFKRDLAQNIWLDEHLRINEDVLFCFQLFSKSNKSIFLDSCLYNYHIRKKTSATNTTDRLTKSRDSSIVCRYIYDNVEENMKNIAAQRLINAYLGYYRALYKSRENEELIRIEKELTQLKADKRMNNKKQLLSYFLLRTFPAFYCITYDLYDRIRKPNWDVN